MLMIIVSGAPPPRCPLIPPFPHPLDLAHAAFHAEQVILSSHLLPDLFHPLTWLTPQHMPEELLDTMPPIMHESMEAGSGPILYCTGSLCLCWWAARMRFTSPPISPGCTVTMLPSPCGEGRGGAVGGDGGVHRVVGGGSMGARARASTFYVCAGMGVGVGVSGGGFGGWGQIIHLGHSSNVSHTIVYFARNAQHPHTRCRCAEVLAGVTITHTTKHRLTRIAS